MYDLIYVSKPTMRPHFTDEEIVYLMVLQVAQGHMEQEIKQNLNTSEPICNLNLYWCFFLYIGVFTNFRKHYPTHARSYYKLILL